MIWIEAFWIDYYHGHLNCLNISEKQNNFDKPQLAAYVCQGTCYGAFTFVYFNIEEEFQHKKNWKNIYKILSKTYLLKMGYNQIVVKQELNKKFFQELLYILGLQESTVDNKKVIVLDSTNSNSIASQTMRFLMEEKGRTKEKAEEDAFQLSLLWINRILFIKLFEGQLITFNGDRPEYHIMSNEKIHNFEDINSLFFEVLGKRERTDSDFLNQFNSIPYLNSSLFERSELERMDTTILCLKNISIPKKSNSILGKKRENEIPLLEYILDFFNAYNFTSKTIVDTNVEKHTSEIIDASVLGLIFEKINGYKEGSFYTKGFVTEYICQDTIEKCIINKLNKEYAWNCSTINDLKMKIADCSFDTIVKINEIINSIKICDPSVGSGHFLVSALNRIIALKKELGVLLKCDNTKFTECNIKVVNDVLCVYYGQGNEFVYNPLNYESQIIQKTLFCEKRTIIENCLYGVDINPNAKSICQLRLWIELLKNAYYENNVMETLPNIDINIKCGNSLVHKLDFSIGKKIGTGNTELQATDLKKLRDYKALVKRYKLVSDKAEKENINSLVVGIKESLYNKFSQVRILDINCSLGVSNQSKYDSDLFSDAFEWAIEFPEILSENGEFEGFDCIVGNPPYIRIQEIQHRYVDYYKEKYSTAYERADISTMFIELGYNLIKKDGLITFITSNQFINTKYGEAIRKYILSKHLLYKIVEFGDLPVFDEALTYVDIFFFMKKWKSSEDEYIEYHKVPKLPFVVPEESEYLLIPYTSLNENPWVLENQNVTELVGKIKNVTTKVLSEYAKCWAGVYTGLDSLLMYNMDEEIPVDEDITISTIRADSCSRYGYAKPTRKIYYPYHEMEEETVIYSLDEIQQRFPRTYEFLLEHEIELKQRKDSRRLFSEFEEWYKITRFGKLANFKKMKIVSPGEVKHNKFCLDITGSAFSCGRVFSMTTESDMNILYLLGFLNSKICEFYLHNISPRKANNYYSYNATNIDSLPFIYDVGNEKQIVELVADVLQRKENNEKTADIEEQIDMIFFEMYQINETEREIIKDYLNSEDK